MSHKTTTAFLLMLFLALPLSMGAKKYTLVIDAGHGGKDAGALGAVSKEKDLTLRYALAFGRMVERNCSDVNVIYTRKTDRFLELWQRAEIANKNKADLFISVHINSLPKGRTARGFQTYTLGRGRNTGKAGIIENLEVAKRENAVILQEDNYKKRYSGFDPNSPESDIFIEFVQEDNMVNSIELAKHMQKHVCKATGRQDQGAHQDNLAVLRLTSMPGCLVELGFISTSDEERFLNSESAVEKYARGMFNAFQAFRSRSNPAIPVSKIEKTPVETTVTPDSSKNDSRKKQREDAQQPDKGTEKQVKSPEKISPVVSDDGVAVFKVQFLTSDRKLKAGAREFKGLADVESYKEGAIWKYTVGSSANYDEIYRLRKQVAQKFPQAFIIAFRNGAKVDAEKARQEYKKRK